MEKTIGSFNVRISGLSKLRNFIQKKKNINKRDEYSMYDRSDRRKKKNYAESEEFNVGKTKWVIECERKDGRYWFYLGMIENTDVEAEYSIRIISKKPDVDDINNNETSLDRSHFNNEVYKVYFYSSKDISNFLMNDIMEFQVSISIKRVALIGCYEVDFSKPTKLSNIVLLVEEREIHVNRQFLSMHSKVFEEMLSNNEETIFEINDIKGGYECIIELCRIIYPGADLLAVDWYLGFMLKLAEKYDVQYVRNVVTELLMTEKTLVDEDEEETLFTKYLIADEHKLKELHAAILNSMSKKDIKDILIEECRYMQLSDDSKKSLVERLMDERSEEVEEVENCHKLDFSTQNKYSDVCLVVEGKKIYVNKTYLAIHSSFFEAMFFSNFKEKNQAEIVLKDLDHDLFVDVLTLIDPQAQIRVQKEKICDLLEMADRFDIQRVCYLCERFLMNSTEMDDSEKLDIAEKYSLKNLQKLLMKKAKQEDNVNV